MAKIGSDGPAHPTVDRSTFTEAQWEALSLYVEAHKRQRNFYRTALPVLCLVVLAWGVTRSIQSGTTGTAVVPGWLQNTIAAVAVVVGLSGFGLFRLAVRHCRSRLRASGISGEWIEGLDRYSSGRV